MWWRNDSARTSNWPHFLEIPHLEQALSQLSLWLVGFMTLQDFPIMKPACNLKHTQMQHRLKCWKSYAWNILIFINQKLINDNCNYNFKCCASHVLLHLKILQTRECLNKRSTTLLTWNFVTLRNHSHPVSSTYSPQVMSKQQFFPPASSASCCTSTPVTWWQTF